MRLSAAEARRLRARGQHLSPGRASHDAATLLRSICGVQAQYPAAAALAVRARTAGVLAHEVERARVQARSIVRTWCMRGTLHLLAAEDFGWLVPLHGPHFIRRSRLRHAQLGLDEKLAARSIDGLCAILAHGRPLTREEVTERLAGRRAKLAGQAAYHLLRRAALEGLVCLGPDRGREPTYVLVERWLPAAKPLPEDAALATLARRYFQAFAPATLDDLACWSGLPAAMLRRGLEGIAGEAVEVRIGGERAFMLGAQLEDPLTSCSPPVRAGGQGSSGDRAERTSPTVRLVPGYDPYLLGYRSKDMTIAASHRRRVYGGGGVLHAAVLQDGYAVGTWTMRRDGRRIEVSVSTFQRLSAAARTGLLAEVEDIGRFLEAAAEAKLAPVRGRQRRGS